VVLILAGLCAAVIARQRLRLSRLASAWQSMCERSDWHFVPSRGPWYDRRDFRVAVPSPLGGIEVTWNPGYRGSPATTVFRRSAPAAPHLSLQLDGKLDPEPGQERVPSGDQDYDLLYRASSHDPALLAAMLDSEWRREHLGIPCDIVAGEGELSLSAAGFVEDESRFRSLLDLSDAFLRRLLDHTGTRIVD
jgi:hypothetical protein